jgi:hypothetical protein
MKMDLGIIAWLMDGKICTGICVGVHKKAKVPRFRVPSSEVIDWQNFP